MALEMKTKVPPPLCQALRRGARACAAVTRMRDSSAQNLPRGQRGNYRETIIARHLSRSPGSSWENRLHVFAGASRDCPSETEVKTTVPTKPTKLMRPGTPVRKKGCENMCDLKQLPKYLVSVHMCSDNESPQSRPKKDDQLSAQMCLAFGNTKGTSFIRMLCQSQQLSRCFAFRATPPRSHS